MWSRSLHAIWYQVSHTLQQTILLDESEYKHMNPFYFPPSRFRSCSYGGGQAQLGGLAYLCEISTPLTNSYKNIMCLWANPSKWDLHFFPESHLDQMNIFHMNTHGWASLANWDRVFCNGHVYISFWNSFLATVNTTMNTVKILIKDSPYKQTPKNPRYFINFLLFLYRFF